MVQPCEIAAPLSVSLDASGQPVIAAIDIARNCGGDPVISVVPDASEGYGYVVSIGF